MNRESRLSGVPILLRPDKLELLSRDVDKDPVLNPLETEGELADGEETCETVFLLTRLPALSNDVEGSLFEEEETDNVGLIEGFLELSDLLILDPVDDLKLLSLSDTGSIFLASETLERVSDFVEAEGKELLLSSGRDSLTGSDAEVAFLPVTLATLFRFFIVDDFSTTPPVLFLLAPGTEFKLGDEAGKLVLVTFELECKLLFGSVFFLIEPVGAKRLEVAAIVGLVVFVTFFLVSTEVTEDSSTEF